MAQQSDLFGGPPLPDGLRYLEALLSPVEQAELLRSFEGLPFREFEFHGFLGKRRTVSFGWKYDFEARRLAEADPIPDFLLPLRDRAADFAGVPAGDLQQALVTEYGPGAGIGWHKDKAVFGQVVGISLGAPCTMRLRRQVGGKWQRASLTLEPRSAYLFSGEVRADWEHSIPPVVEARYSVTFRTMAAAP